jgi:streptomycin 6-kinase
VGIRRVNEVCERKLAELGVEGARWYDALDDVVAELEQRWSITVGDGIGGGSHGFVAAATRANGEQAVLKIALPDMRGAAKSLDMLRVLEAGQGHGYVAVFAYDEDRRAVLMERLGPELEISGKPVDEMVEIVCGVLAPWAAPPDGLRLMTGAEKAHWLGGFVDDLWEELGHPIPEAAVREAQAFARSRESAHDSATAVLVHGDAHQGNVLLASDGTYRLIDPDPILGEPAVDLSALMRDWNPELLAMGDPAAAAIERCHRISTLTGVAPQPVWEWGYLERVSTALYCHSLGITEWSAPAYEVIEACVGLREV